MRIASSFVSRETSSSSVCPRERSPTMSRRWLVGIAMAVTVLCSLPASSQAQFRRTTVPFFLYNPWGWNYSPWSYPPYYGNPYGRPRIYVINNIPPASYPSSAAHVPPAEPPPQPQPQPRVDEFDNRGKPITPTSNYPQPENASSSSPARLEVHLPAEAQLWVDGKKTNQTGATRKFTTPTLTPNRDFYYELRAEWNEQGRTVADTRRVTVRAGERVKVDVTTPEPTGKDVEELKMPKPK